MEKWICRNLKKFGNVAISEKTLKKYDGKEKIVELLKKENFDCNIRETKIAEYSNGNKNLGYYDKVGLTTTYIIEVKNV